MAPVDNRYLLRVWREPVRNEAEGNEPMRTGAEGRGGLQVTLRDVSDGQVRSFEELDEMFEYLRSSLAEPDTSDGHGSATSRRSGGTDG